LVAWMGMVESFSRRDIVGGVISMGQTLLLLTFIYAAYTAVRRVAETQQETTGSAQLSPATTLLSGGLAGLATAACLAALVLIGPPINLRAVFSDASPALYATLTFGLGTTVGTLVLLVAGVVIGTLTSGLSLLPDHIRRVVTLGLSLVMAGGLLEGLLRVMFEGWGFVGQLFLWIFAARGLSIPGAITVFILVAGGSLAWRARGDHVKQRLADLPTQRQRQLRWGSQGLLLVILLLLPRIVGSYPSEVMDNIGLYILMGLGLNIVVGFAGLLDLGYVAFFAIGAYIMGVLISPEISFIPVHFTFWTALPFAVGGALLAGIILGIPVLGMRGDYLAIVTLGFGEIIRLVALSDWLKPYIGGSNGITRIPKPPVGPLGELATPQSLYYLILAGCLVAGFVSWRLKDSRLGRAWMAMREDEDVAEAVGIHLVTTKLLAFATGAAFSGLAGAIFASKLTSIYPHSFHLLVSINVLCLIIVGGIGSIPGVIVGALILVGVPELLREFEEYRLMMYGAFLVVMMLTRPEGLWPEATHRRELHESEMNNIDPDVEKRITVPG
jgi:branched-chain amino acid transport system permease protein